MSRAEVSEIFGGPSGITSPKGHTYSELAGIHGSRAPDGVVSEVWGGDHGVAIIRFDEQGNAVHTHWIHPAPGFLKSVLDVFGL